MEKLRQTFKNLPSEVQNMLREQLQASANVVNNAHLYDDATIIKHAKMINDIKYRLDVLVESTLNLEKIEAELQNIRYY